jgi:hypothetical protein
MISLSLYVLALMFSPQQAAAATPQDPAPAPAQAPVTVASATTAEAQPEAETRRVCRFETVIGSNRRTRICRDVPRQGVQDAQTRDFMRDTQRARMPDSN